MIVSPLERYRSDLRREDFSADPAQENAVHYMQRLYVKLVGRMRRGGIVGRFLAGISGGTGNGDIRGLYLWGGVGRGKTYLIDCFFDCLPLDNKLRLHFYRFMQRVHNELKQLQDVEDPLAIVAGKFADQACVLCLDEFHVVDIADAMLLAGLLDGLFARGVTLVATSNEEPDALYRDGLQRQRFVPAIELIKRHAHVVNVGSGVDYRLRYLDRAEIYHRPLDENADAMLVKNFLHICPNEGTYGESLEVEGRVIDTVRCGDGVVWFEFAALCDGPRGAADYIEIAKCFQSVLLANVPVMDDMQNDRAKRFIMLVDEFYDRNVTLIVTAEAEPAGLYKGRRLQREFRRTISRLKEMGTHSYLARQHLT